MKLGPLRLVQLGGAATLLFGIAVAPVTANPIGIVNGDFELDADNTAPPTGWTDLSSSASFWVGVVDEVGNPDSAHAPPNPGVFLSTARQSAAVDSQPLEGRLVQTVDLSAFGAAIDAGDQVLDVGFVWNSADNRDTAVVSLSYFASTDGSGALLGSGYSVALDDDSGFSYVGDPDWLSATVGGPVPATARSLSIAIDTTRSGGSETNVWFDDFTGEIRTVPEPTSIFSGAVGAILAFGCRRRKSSQR